MCASKRFTRNDVYLYRVCLKLPVGPRDAPASAGHDDGAQSTSKSGVTRVPDPHIVIYALCMLPHVVQVRGYGRAASKRRHVRRHVVRKDKQYVPVFLCSGPSGRGQE